MAKILIVEDDRRIAELERDYLESGGCETVLLADGRQVIEEVEQGSYDLVLLDVMRQEAAAMICAARSERRLISRSCLSPPAANL